MKGNKRSRRAENRTGRTKADEACVGAGGRPSASCVAHPDRRAAGQGVVDKGTTADVGEGAAQAWLCLAGQWPVQRTWVAPVMQDQDHGSVGDGDGDAAVGGGGSAPTLRCKHRKCKNATRCAWERPLIALP